MADSYGRKERRKSLSVFNPSSTAANLTASLSHDRSPSDETHVLKKRKNRRNSVFFGGNRNVSPKPQNLAASATADAEIAAWAASMASSTPPEAVARPRRKSLQKKRASVFGSLRSLHSFENDDDTKSTGRSKNSSGDDDDASAARTCMIGNMVLHHGEVQTTGGMWRKKSQFLVLTNTHLVRFKSQKKAAEAFPSIPASFERPNTSSNLQHHRQSIASVSSIQDAQLSAAADTSVGIPLNSIIAVYMLDDGRFSSTVELAYVDDRTHKAAFVQMQTPEIQELNLWMVGIRSAAEMTRMSDPLPFGQRTIEHVARILEYERDYDPETFRMFRVIQMASSGGSSGSMHGSTGSSSGKYPARTSSEDITKLSPTGCYLALGSHKLHLIPFQQKPTHRGSVVSLPDMESASSFGLMNLTSLSMEWGDDSLHLTFRVPLRKPFSIFLASVHSLEIAFWIRQHTEFLRPLWIRQPFDFIVPRDLDDESIFPPVTLDEDYGCFDRTLVAYSASYDIDTSNIRYTIDMQCEDAPCFKLLPPAYTNRQEYTSLELIAVLRALRYNESFRSISFNRVSLDALQGIRDLHGVDKDARLTRAGSPVSIPGQENLSVLSQEIRALTLKSKYLRRMDFSYSLSRVPQSNSESHDPGCGIPEAIFPVCRRELTSVDWVVLNGIKLGDSDLDYLVDAASQRSSHLRALEVGNCGLSVHDIDLLLSTIVAQESTLEAIDISGVQGRLNPYVLQQYIGYFSQIRKINLSRISRTSGPEPLITAETLFHWQLDELSLSQTPVNTQTVDAIAIYLASKQSLGLRVLHLDQCGLNGQDVAVLLHAIASASETPRELHMYVNENRLDNGCIQLFKAIGQNETPSHLSMRMIDFKEEKQFRLLVDALRKNRSLRFLDISKASLPYDAGPDTCKSLQAMFEENDTLEDLDISGDSAHLDVARFGIGLNLALTGLKLNKSLKVLRIEHQRLGLQGANTLSSVLEDNTSLREIYCESNDINLQSFTVLVNGLQRNRSLLSLSCMDRDRAQSLNKLRREIEGLKREVNYAQSSTSSSIRRSLHAAVTVGHAAVGNKLTKNPPPAGHYRSGTMSSSSVAPQVLDHDIDFVLQSLHRKWDAEVARLRRYLFRNYNIASGMDDEPAVEGDDAYSDGRPNTAASLGTMLENLKFEVTVSADELPNVQQAPPPPPTASTMAEDDVETPKAAPGTHLDIFDSLDAEPTGVMLDQRQRPQTAPYFAPEYAPTSSARLAVPVPAVPSTVVKPGSVRSARSSSLVSSSTGTAASSRSTYGTASSALKGFLGSSASKERRKIEKMRPGLCVSNDKAPQLDWAPPKLDWAPPKVDMGGFQ
ncbi:hypothetical protein SI65_03468 [Aspergillus cristatus]|uniref:PH domain-containing protein n=1 Tax=Aspergillus cristatus TaxID=573508 RepID=A0A1E3BHG5_ASPCR|nr:hypothetical protein SI65_03468 [Aspergillus cristatus]